MLSPEVCAADTGCGDSQRGDSINTPSPEDSLKVAIVEDVRALRDGFRMLIDGTDGFCCVGSYRSMEEALDKIGAALPDVVLADIGLPGMNGIEEIGRAS